MDASSIIDVYTTTLEHIKIDYPNADKKYKLSSFVCGATDFARFLAKWNECYDIDFAKRLDEVRKSIFPTEST